MKKEEINEAVKQYQKKVLEALDALVPLIYEAEAIRENITTRGIMEDDELYKDNVRLLQIPEALRVAISKVKIGVEASADECLNESRGRGQFR